MGLQLMYPYQTELPLAEMKVFLKKFKGGEDVPTADLIQACHGIVSFGLGHGFVPNLQQTLPQTTGQVCFHLEQATEKEDQTAIPWELIVPVVFDILVKLLRKRIQ